MPQAESADASTDAALITGGSPTSAVTITPPYSNFWKWPSGVRHRPKGGAALERLVLFGCDDTAVIKGCCYFPDGGPQPHVNEWRGAQHFAIYEGRERKGNELVINTRIGTLSLLFARSLNRK
jgi:hypothetical protein